MSIKKTHNENGNILASTLLVMLAMNLLAVTLVQTSMREFKTADYKHVSSSNFYLAESCIKDSVSWFKGLGQPPVNLPYTITHENISHLYSGNETQQVLGQLARYSYNCTTTGMSVISVEGKSLGVGENIGSKDAYGLSGDLSPSYYYRIESTGSGPSESNKKLVAVVAVKY